MIKYLKMILFLFLCKISYSQIYYSNYLDTTSEWRELSKDILDGDASYIFATRFFEGFENVNGFVYYKMYVTKIKRDYINDGYPYATSPVYTQFLGLVREGADGKFYKYDTTTNTDVVYFDNQVVINAQLGDSFSSLGISADCLNNPPTCTVANISNLSFAGMNLKVLGDTSIFQTGAFNDIIIEGIGYSNYFCGYQYVFDFSHFCAFDNMIFCYTKQNQTYQILSNGWQLNDPILNCNTAFPAADRQSLSVVNLEKESPIIFPNPTNSSMTISLKNEKIKSIALFDIQGRRLQTNLSEDNSFSLDLSKYEVGTYFLVIQSENSVFKEKIVKK